MHKFFVWEFANSIRLTARTRFFFSLNSTVKLRQIGLNPGAGRYENSSRFAAALRITI
jgi:hypothetical protein